MLEPRVYLIGAGPGDPELITIKGHRILTEADVIVFDHLVHRRMLSQVRDDAETIDVGPAAPQSLEQNAISLLLAEKVREGKAVARLKWGDPFVFDSGGEEALFLHEQGISSSRASLRRLAARPTPVFRSHIPRRVTRSHWCEETREKRVDRPRSPGAASPGSEVPS